MFQRRVSLPQASRTTWMLRAEVSNTRSQTFSELSPYYDKERKKQFGQFWAWRAAEPKEKHARDGGAYLIASCPIDQLKESNTKGPNLKLPTPLKLLNPNETPYCTSTVVTVCIYKSVTTCVLTLLIKYLLLLLLHDLILSLQSKACFIEGFQL